MESYGIIRTNAPADEPPIFLFGRAVDASCRALDTVSVEHNDMISAGLQQLFSLEAL
jgi:hypothetical protein